MLALSSSSAGQRQEMEPGEQGLGLIGSMSKPRESLHAFLYRATHASHVRLSRHPLLHDLVRPELTEVCYLRVLTAYARLYAPFETLIRQASPWRTGGFSYSGREKWPWLIQDLEYFGADISLGSGQAQLLRLQGSFQTLGDFAGLLYVIEGSTLGGQVISRHLECHHGWTAQEGARFFNAYGEATASRWHRFVAWLDACRMDRQESERAAQSAKWVFDLLEATLDVSR